MAGQVAPAARIRKCERATARRRSAPAKRSQRVTYWERRGTAVERLRVGIIGAGWMGVVHATSWQDHATRGEIVAVADVSLPRAQDIAERFTGGQARAYTTAAELLADPAVEAVDICLPHHLHAGTIAQAAHAGKAILCEKPLCMTLDEAAAIGRVLRETGATFMCAHNQLFQPSLVAAREALAVGVLGEVYVVRSIEVGQNRMFATGQLPVVLGPGESSHAWRADCNGWAAGRCWTPATTRPTACSPSPTTGPSMSWP
jgi:hypothetical protein